MIDEDILLLNAWYQLLNGNISLPVYRTDAPPDATDYVLLRTESSSDRSNNTRFGNELVIITEVVTRFGSGEIINETAAHQVNSEIGQLVLPTPSKHNLPPQGGIQVVTIKRQNKQAFPEDDGSNRYYRVITRNIHRVYQQ